MHQVVVLKGGYKWTPFFLNQQFLNFNKNLKIVTIKILRYDKNKSSSPLNLVSKLIIFFQNSLVLGPQKRGLEKVVLFIPKKNNIVQSVAPLKF